MELIQAEERLNINQIQSIAGELLVKLSYLSLGMMIVLIPLRYRWILQTHLSPPVYKDYTNLLLFPTDIFLVLTVVLWLISLALKPRQISADPKLLTSSLACLVVFSAVSIFFSVDWLVSLYNTIQLLLLFCLYLYLINEIHNLTLLIIPVGLQVLIQAVVGITQVLRQHSMGLASLQELALDPSWKGVSIVWSNGVRSLRAYGLSDHPNLLGGCLAFALVLLAVGYLDATPAWRPWIAGLFGLGNLALLLTFSRAAWVALVAGLILIGLWLILLQKRDSVVRLAGLCGAALVLLLPFLWEEAPILGSRLNLDGSFTAATPENQSIHERSLLNTLAYRMIAHKPLIGSGVGTFPEALQQLEPTYPFDYQPPHIVPLEVAAETGLPGAAIYLLALTTPWIYLFKNGLRRMAGSKKGGRSAMPSALSSPLTGPTPAMWIAALKRWAGRISFAAGTYDLALVGASGALLAITVVSCLDYYPWLINSGRTWQWLLWGLWGGIYTGIARKNSHD